MVFIDNGIGLLSSGKLMIWRKKYERLNVINQQLDPKMSPTAVFKKIPILLFQKTEK